MSLVNVTYWDYFVISDNKLILYNFCLICQCSLTFMSLLSSSRWLDGSSFELSWYLPVYRLFFSLYILCHFLAPTQLVGTQSFLSEVIIFFRFYFHCYFITILWFLKGFWMFCFWRSFLKKKTDVSCSWVNVGV